jgi:hypothetical protein
MSLRLRPLLGFDAKTQHVSADEGILGNFKRLCELSLPSKAESSNRFTEETSAASVKFPNAQRAPFDIVQQTRLLSMLLTSSVVNHYPFSILGIWTSHR